MFLPCLVYHPNPRLGIYLLHFSHSLLLLLLFFFFLVSLGLHLHHMEVPRLGVESELQLPAYTTATAMPDTSQVCNLHHSSQQHWILNPVNEARGWSHILMDTSQVHDCWVTTGTPLLEILFPFPFPHGISSQCNICSMFLCKSLSFTSLSYFSVTILYG